MDDDLVGKVVAILQAGEVVVLPTDTVYGLAALPGNLSATRRLFELKSRDAGSPIAVLCATTDQALALAAVDLDPAVAPVVSRWWPGPLTLVLPRRPDLHLHLGAPQTTIGLRVPRHDLVQAVAARIGPLAVTSANRHDQPTPATAEAAAAALGEGVALVVEGGALEATASTVMDATTRPWRTLRRGSIDPAEVLAVATAAGDGAGLG